MVFVIGLCILGVVWLMKCSLVELFVCDVVFVLVVVFMIVSEKL